MSLPSLHPRPDSVPTTPLHDPPLTLIVTFLCLLWLHSISQGRNPGGIQCKEVIPDTMCIKMTKMDATGPYLYICA